MNYIKPDETKHAYVLGIDFGHGETSADLCAIQWNDSPLQLTAPESVEIFPGVKAIKSVLLVERKGTSESIYIGQRATSRYGNPKYQEEDVECSYYSYFKKTPSLMPDNVMRVFMQEVYQQIRRLRTELKDDNHLVYIACPSDSKKWTEEEMEKYAKIALEAGIPLAKVDEKNIGIIRESRAAFLKARSNVKYKSSIEEGLLLIDFGSSTVDLTYYSSLFTDKPIDDGYECGASNVENEITENLKSEYSIIKDAIDLEPSAKTAVLLAVQEAKEHFYSYDSEDMDISLNLSRFTKGMIKERSVGGFYSNEKIEKILNSYVKEIRNAFFKFKEAHLAGKPIKLIFLTGGASRMGFVQTIAREVFDYHDDFYTDTNPSLTISNGIALAGRADLRTYSMEQKLLSSSAIINANIATNTIEKTASRIASRVIDRTSECYTKFANKKYDDNLSSLESDIKSSIDSISASYIMTSAYNDVLRDVANTQIIPSINKIVRDYFPDFKIMEIKSSSSFTLSVKSDSIFTVSSVISSSLSKIEEGLIEGVAKLLWNVGTGSIIAVEGTIANAGIAIINIFKDKPIDYIDVGSAVDEVTFSFRDKTTKLSSSRRNDVKNAFIDNKSTYEISICSDLKSKLKAESSLINQINCKGREEIKDYIRKQIQEARIMLN